MALLRAACLGLAGIGPLVFVPGLNDGFELPKQAFLRVAVLLAALGTASVCLSQASGHPHVIGRRLVDAVRNGPLAAVLVMALVWTVSTVLSIAPSASLWGTYQRWAGLFTQLFFAAVFLAAACAVRSRLRLLELAGAVTVGATVVSVYAIAQWLGWDFVTWSQGVVWGWQPASGRERPFATLGNPDFLGAYLALTLFVTLGGALGTANKRLAWWISLSLQALALVLSQCRSAWIGVGVGLVLLAPLLAWGRERRWRRWAAAASTIAASAASLLVVGRAMLPGDGLVGRLTSIADPNGGTAAVRLLLWRAAIPRVLERPLFGTGPDTFGTLIVDHYPPELWRLEQPAFPVDRAHSALVETLTTQGLVGALAMVGLIAAVGHAVLCSVLRLRERQRGAALPICVGLALVAHLVEQQLNVEVTAASTLAWLLSGTLIGSTTPGESQVETAVRRNIRVGGVLATAALVLAGVWWIVQPLRADWSYAAALAAERRGDGRAAQLALQTTISAWPNEPTYWNELARAHIGVARASQGEASLHAYRSAVEAADHALSLNPASTQLLSNWSLIAAEAAARMADRQLGERAAAAATEATTRAPAYWVFWRSAGATSFDLADYATAEARLLQAVKLFDGDDATWSALGDAAVQLRDVATAREAYGRALDLVPTNAHARDALARLPAG